MKEKELLDTKQAFAQCVEEGITVMMEEKMTPLLTTTNQRI